MFRFLTFVAFLGFLYSGFRIYQTDGGRVPVEKSAAVSSVSGTKEIQTPTSGTAGNSVSYQQRPQVYLFTGRSWCQASRSFDAKVLSSPEWKALTLHHVVYKEVVLPPDFARASKPHRDLVSKFSIQSVPTLVVVSSSGAEMGRRPVPGTSAAQCVKWIREITRQGLIPGFAAGL
jgi:thiol:disulfide interchange protein